MACGRGLTGLEEDVIEIARESNRPSRAVAGSPEGSGWEEVLAFLIDLAKVGSGSDRRDVRVEPNVSAVVRGLRSVHVVSYRRLIRKKKTAHWCPSSSSWPT